MTRWLLGLSALCCISCVDTLDVDPPANTYGRLVIEGFVERGDQYHFLVHVSGTYPTDGIERTQYPDAEVKILLNGTTAISLTNGVSTFMDIKQFHDMYGGEPESAKFSLRATIGADTYESDEQRILENPGAADLQTELKTRAVLNDIGRLVDKNFVALKADARIKNDQNEAVSLRWDVSGVYIYEELEPKTPQGPRRQCFLNDIRDDNSISLIDATDLKGDVVAGLLIDEVPVNAKFSRGYVYNVLQKTLSRDAARYWSQIKANSSRTAGIFDTPVGQVAGNLRHVQDADKTVLGYFYGTAIDTLRIYVDPSEVGRPRTSCEIIYDPGYCRDCRRVPGSTDQRPHYWPK